MVVESSGSFTGKPDAITDEFRSSRWTFDMGGVGKFTGKRQGQEFGGRMARKSKLGVCRDCKAANARCGIVTTFYLLSTGLLMKRPASKAREQIKGSLRTYGLCSRCFIKFVVKEGMDTAKANRLRRELGLKEKPRN
jgi:hypothetical protein